MFPTTLLVFHFPGLRQRLESPSDARDAWLSLPRAGLKKHLLLLLTARWKALDTRSQVAEPTRLFFALKKVSLSAVRSQCNGMARARATCAAGLKKHLPVLPTARWRAIDTRSQVAETTRLFFA